MTKKSANRRSRDADIRKANGGRLPKASVQREKAARVWFELKTVHKRSSAYILKMAEQLERYKHPLVLLKISKNGQSARFMELFTKISQKAVGFNQGFQELWDTHKDKNSLCKSSAEFDQAVRLFEAYQAFDIDFYTELSPIISEMNEIFNGALKQLLDAQASIQHALENGEDPAALAAQDTSVVTDVTYREVKEQELPTAAEGLVNPEQPIDDLATNALRGVIHPNL